MRNQSNTYFKYALNHIICNCPKCLCPNATNGEGNYSFVYVKESLKLMYFSVPKSGSSSLRKGFFENNHTMSIQPTLLLEDAYFKFTFIRHPLDRLISTWKMFTQRPFRRYQLLSMTGKADYSLEEFIQIIKVYSNHHWQPQSLFIPNNIDFVGRLSTFLIDIKYIHHKIEMPFDEKEWLIKKNSTQRNKNYHFYFKGNEHLLEQVYNLYYEDFERFGFDINSSLVNRSL